MVSRSSESNLFASRLSICNLSPRGFSYVPFGIDHHNAISQIDLAQMKVIQNSLLLLGDRMTSLTRSHHNHTGEGQEPVHLSHLLDKSCRTADTHNLRSLTHASVFHGLEPLLLACHGVAHLPRGLRLIYAVASASVPALGRSGDECREAKGERSTSSDVECSPNARLVELGGFEPDAEAPVFVLFPPFPTIRISPKHCGILVCRSACCRRDYRVFPRFNS